MKKLKSAIVFILVIVLCLSLFTAAYAKNNNGKNSSGKQTVLSADVQKLVELGLLVGSGKDGVTDAYAKSKPTRIQAFIVYLRLIDESEKLDQFIYHDGDKNFDDHKGYSSFVQKGMGFAKAHPEYNWIGSNGRFNPMAHLTAKEYAKVLLAALGYTIPGDFTWSTVESFAEGLGLNVPEGAFTFEVFAAMTVQALDMHVKGTAQKLIDRLGLGTTTDTTKPTVTDVVLSVPYADGVSGKVTVYFSEAIKPETLQTTENYKVDLDGSGTAYVSTLLKEMAGSAAVPSADKKSVTLTIPGSALNGGTAAGAGVTEITISGLKDAAGNTMDTVTAFVRTDSLPVITARETQDLDKDGYLDAVKLTFSESIKDSTVVAADFDVAGYTGESFSSITAGDTADNTVIYITFTESNTPDTGVTPTVAYTQGTLEDLAGNKLASTGAQAMADKAAPVVMTALPAGTLTAGGTPSTAALILSEDVTTANRADILSAVQAHAALNDLVTTGDIVTTFVWTTDRLLTVSITANVNGGTDPDKIVLTALSYDLHDAAGNKTTLAQIIK